MCIVQLICEKEGYRTKKIEEDKNRKRRWKNITPELSDSLKKKQVVYGIIY